MVLELVKIFLIKTESVDGQQLVSLVWPALSDVVIDVCTPE